MPDLSINEPGPAFAVHGNAIRVPLTRTKGLTDRTTKQLQVERERGTFALLADFHRCVRPLPQELAAAFHTAIELTI